MKRINKEILFKAEVTLLDIYVCSPWRWIKTGEDWMGKEGIVVPQYLCTSVSCLFTEQVLKDLGNQHSSLWEAPPAPLSSSTIRTLSSQCPGMVLLSP